MSKLIVGCGYVGRRLAQHWVSQGEQVFATTRKENRAAMFSREGITPILWDVTGPPPHDFPAVNTVVFSVGFDRTSRHSIESVYVDGLRRCLDWCDTEIHRFVYCSSTGVYGDAKGEWIDESSPCVPTRAGGKACLAAERLLENHHVLGPKSVILRLAGIYGVGRLPMLENLRQGAPLAVDAEGYLNLVHVDDIVCVIDACVREDAGGVAAPLKLCVADGHPIRRREFYEQLAANLGVSAPSFESPPSDSSRAERARGSKRISNQQMKELLNLSLRYPTYREGLQSIQPDTHSDTESA